MGSQYVMTHPNRTPEDEKLSVISTLNAWYETLPRPGSGKIVEVRLDEIADFILADRKAQATALLEKGPEDLKLTRDESDSDYFYGSGNNHANKEWRSIIKEVGGLDG